MKYLSQFDSIDELELSVRSRNALCRANIFTVDDLLKFPKEKFSTLRNLGSKSIAEIISATEKIAIAPSGISQNNSNSCEKIEARPKFMSTDGKMHYDIPINKLKLSTRSYNCIKNAGICYFSQLQPMSEPEIRSLHGLGNQSRAEILSIQRKITSFVNAQQEVPFPADAAPAEKLGQQIVQNIIQKIPVSVKSLYDAVLSCLSDQTIPGSPLFPLESSLLKKISDIPILYDAIRKTVLHKLDQPPYSFSLTELRKVLPYCLNNEAMFLSLLTEMQQEGLLLCRQDQIYEKCYPSVLEYVASLSKEQSRHILQERLSGKTLEEIGKEYGLTRERVRQVVVKCLSEAPRVSEDRYAAVYQKYDITEQDFLSEFQASKVTYNYLSNKYKHGKTALFELMEDTEMPGDFRRASERISYKNYVILNGERVFCSRPGLSEYVLRTASAGGITFKEFIRRYQTLLEKLGQSDNPKLLITGRGYENKLASNRHVLWKYRQKLRYYNIDAYDFTDFFKALDLKQYHDVEYSTLKFFREYPDVMKEYDIEDEYELHNLLKKICTPTDFPDLHFKRMPNIEFGTADRDVQVKKLLFSLGTIENTAFAEAYEKEYGVLAQTVLANYTQSIESYFHAGVYCIDASPLPDSVISRLRQLFVNDFYLLSDIQEIYAQEFPEDDSGRLNPLTIKLLGFHVYANYAIADRFPSATEYFQTILTQNELVNTQTFPHGLTSTTVYTNTVYKLKAAYDIIEYEPFKFINICRLNRAGIEKSALADYCRKVYESAGTQYFTIYSLQKNGFSHALNSLGFSEWFYSSVLAEDKEHFSYRRIGKNRLFRCGKDKILETDFLTDLMCSHDLLPMKVSEAIEIMKNEYNISIDPYKLVERIKGSSLYYDTIDRKIYRNYDTYHKIQSDKVQVV